VSAPSGLRQRVPTAIVLAALLLLDLFALPPIATLMLIAVVLIGGAWEWSAFVHASPRVRALYVLVVALAVVACDPVRVDPDALQKLLWCAAIWWLVAFFWIVFAPARTSRVMAAVAGVLALVPTGAALGYLRLVDDRGAWLVLFVLLVIMAADVGAYFFGHALGRVKLAPRVSPGKSWEGVLGGVVLSQAVAYVGATLLGLPTDVVAVLALVAVAFSVVGDLTESLLKRHAGIKDSGRLLPGHGGVLDRLDSLSAGVPVFVLGLLRTGLIA
jgi:phosphatidate cytidylyltransferase